jgi:hypothetical protein
MSEQINLLAEPHRKDTDRIALQLDTQGITPGMILSCGLNVWFVKETTPATKTVYVVPGYDGSPSHNAEAGSVVTVKPRATDWQLFGDVNRAIQSMSSPVSGLYRVGYETSVAEFGHWGTYRINTFDVQSIISVRVRAPWDAQGREVQDRDWRWNSKDGTIRVLNPEFSWATSVDVTYRAPFLTAQGLDTDLVATCGLSDSMLDIPPLGAAAGLLLATEGRRAQVTSQGDSRRPGEVPPGSNSSAAREMRRRYEQRVNDEAARLIVKNPYRTTV